MQYRYNMLKADYRQRTRSYAFLIILFITVYAAYSFVPPPGASYTTLNMAGYQAIYNAAWVGYVSAAMTSVMLSLCGYFLVNSGIKKDIDTGVGLIIATTSITNAGYLLTKLLSNFLVLLTIAGCTFVVSMGMFFLRTGEGQSFVFAHFVLPYLLLTVPALFITSGLAVAGEVLASQRPWVQYLLFFAFFVWVLTAAQNHSNRSVVLDPFGVKTVTTSIKEKVQAQYHTQVENVSFGFIFSSQKRAVRFFTWEGLDWTPLFVLSRLVWIALTLVLVYAASFFFHRFDFRQASEKKKKRIREPSPETIAAGTGSIRSTSLPPLVRDYSIVPFLKTELLLLIRKGNRWWWLLTGAVWISLLFVPLGVAHSIVLPVLWFLQVNRWSELATKEQTHRLHYFTYASYKPLQRMLPAQILAGIVLAVGLALPVMLRYSLAVNAYAVLNLLTGSVLIVLLSICLGIVSGGKKLFEILFFVLTYAILNKIPVLDYLGAVTHSNQAGYLGVLVLLCFALGLISFLVRGYQARHL